MSEKIAEGSRVTLNYRLAESSGRELASSFGEEPLTLTVGDGTLHTHLDRLLVSLVEGDKVRWLLGPEEAFGLHDEAAIHRLPRTDFPPEMVLEPGLILGFATPSGLELPGYIAAMDETEVVVDFNHPLAGRTVIFEVEILAVESAGAPQQDS